MKLKSVLQNLEIIGAAFIAISTVQCGCLNYSILRLPCFQPVKGGQHFELQSRQHFGLQSSAFTFVSKPKDLFSSSAILKHIDFLFVF